MTSSCNSTENQPSVDITPILSSLGHHWLRCHQWLKIYNHETLDFQRQWNAVSEAHGGLNKTNVILQTTLSSIFFYQERYQFGEIFLKFGSGKDFSTDRQTGEVFTADISREALWEWKLSNLFLLITIYLPVPHFAPPFKKMHLKMSSLKWRSFASASMC